MLYCHFLIKPFNFETRKSLNCRTYYVYYSKAFVHYKRYFGLVLLSVLTLTNIFRYLKYIIQVRVMQVQSTNSDELVRNKFIASNTQ